MLKAKFGTVAVLAASGLLVATESSAGAARANAACVTKGGQGTSITAEGAKFQAYEAVLQATDWSMWASWMASSQKIGAAPGYDVSKLKFKCSQGSVLGATCVVRATLCKKA
jgi:hypothetical protein